MVFEGGLGPEKEVGQFYSHKERGIENNHDFVRKLEPNNEAIVSSNDRYGMNTYGETKHQMPECDPPDHAFMTWISEIGRLDCTFREMNLPKWATVPIFKKFKRKVF